MMNTKKVEKSAPELACIAFNSSYFFHYRYFKHFFTKNLINNVPNLCRFDTERQEAIISTLKAEIIFNAILYCEDLALALKTLRKTPQEQLKTIVGIQQRGPGSVMEFYENLKNKDFNYFYELIGCTKLDLSEKDVIQCINKIHTLKKDMVLLGNFFKTFYGFSTAYKHGFLIYPGKLHKTGENVLGELSWNNLMNFIIIDRIPYNVDAVIHIIYSIFSTVVDALIVNIVLDVEEQEKKNFEKQFRLITEEKPEGLSQKIDLISFRVHSAEKKLPLSDSPIGKKVAV